MSPENQLSEKQAFAIRSILFAITEAAALDSVEYRLCFFAKKPVGMTVKVREDHVLFFKIGAAGNIIERRTTANMFGAGFVLPEDEVDPNALS